MFLVKKILLFIIILISINSFSQEIDVASMTQKEVLNLVDKYIEEKDEKVLDVLLSLGTEFPDYKRLIRYYLDNSIELAKKGELEFALVLAEAVLYSDLENSEAQSLYSDIVDMQIEYKERIELERVNAEKKRAELAREEEIEKAKIPPEQIYADIITDNIKVYSEFKKREDSYNLTHYTTNNFIYPLITKNYQSQVYDGYYNLEPQTRTYTGQGVDVGIGAKLDIFNFRLDASGNITYVDLIKNLTKQISGIINISLGISAINFPIFARCGFFYDQYFYQTGTESDVAITFLPSPAIGLGITGLKFLKIFKLDLTSDFLFASTYTESFDYGFFSRAFLTINLIRIESVNFEIRGGVDSFIYNERGLLEHSEVIKIGIGLSRYE